MAHNSGGKYNAVSLTPDRMEDYDRLSPQKRELIRNSPYRFAAKDIDTFPDALIPILTTCIFKDIKNHALAAYGPDHPQAQGEFCCPLKP